MVDSFNMLQPTFSFGKNWQRFLEGINETSLRRARESLTSFTGLRDLTGKTFLDIGSGSGIFSYEAAELNAGRVVSIDVDPFSVACTEHIRERSSKRASWAIYHASVLDEEFMPKLGDFDIVYSWGVLHHTGDMWQAIRNAARRVKPRGLFYIALYNRVEGRFGSAYWLFIKKLYNRYPVFGKYVLENIYVGWFILLFLLRFKNPVREIRMYRQKRGMSWRRDITDWLGGYPYEAANVEDVFRFMKKEFPALILRNIKTTNGIGNNWFLFERND